MTLMGTLNLTHSFTHSPLRCTCWWGPVAVTALDKCLTAWYCVPMLLYALVIYTLKQRDFRSLDFDVNRIFFIKLFITTSDINVKYIAVCLTLNYYISQTYKEIYGYICHWAHDMIGLMLIYLLSIKKAKSPNYATTDQLVLRVFCAK